jgi:hypothetical protein
MSFEKWLQHDDPVINEIARKADAYQRQRAATPPQLSDDEYKSLMRQLVILRSTGDAAADAETRKARAEFFQALQTIAGFVL